MIAFMIIAGLVVTIRAICAVLFWWPKDSKPKPEPKPAKPATRWNTELPQQTQWRICLGIFAAMFICIGLTP